MAVTVNLCPLPKLQFNQNGVPVAGGKLFTYTAGTSTKLATYADPAGTATNNNPIILDANGQCDCFLQGGLSYKLVLAPATDTDPPQNPYWTEDQVSGINQVLSTFGPETGVANAYVVTLTPAPTSYADGQQVVFDAGNTNTDASTLNLNGLGPKQLLVNGQATVANSIVGGQRYVVSYSTTLNAFLVLSSSSPAVQGTTGSFSGNVSIGGLVSGTNGGVLQVGSAGLTTSGSITSSGTVTAASGQFSGSVSVGIAPSGSTDAPQITQTLGAGATSSSDVSSSRAFNTSYTNNTGRPLTVQVAVEVGLNSGGVYYIYGAMNPTAYANGSTTTYVGTSWVGLCMIVPPGQTYKVFDGGTGISSKTVYWTEY